MTSGNFPSCPIINIDDYEVIKQLGIHNPNSTLYLAQDKKKGIKVALTFYSRDAFRNLDDEIDKSKIKAFFREINASTFDFPGIVKPLGYCFPLSEESPTGPRKADSPDHYDGYILVKEFIENGDLGTYLHNIDKKIVTSNPTIRSKIIFGIAAIMKKIHQRNFIHRNLKPPFIFLDSKFEPQISGFVGMRFVDNIYDLTSMDDRVFATPLYAPPELMNQEDFYGPSADVFSFAIVLYHMFTRELFYPDGKRIQSSFRHLSAVSKGIRFKKPPTIPEHYWELIQKCWDQDPAKRPTFVEITELLKDDKYALREEGPVDFDDLHEYQQRIDSQNIQSQDNTKTLEAFIRVLKEKKSETVDLVTASDYTEVNVIGQGSTSIVKLVVKNEKYAKKELQLYDHKSLKRFLKETEILWELRHPCIIRIFGFDYGNDNTPPSILLSFEPTTLEAAIKEQKLSNQEKNRITVEIVLGMRYIHSKNLMHRDLKPSNILLSKNNHVRITDFGLVKEDWDLDTSFSRGVGTLRFMPPELLSDDDPSSAHYTNKVDVYPFGIMLIYIIDGQYPPFKTSDLFKKAQPTLPSTLVPWVSDLISRCLSISPKDRPSFDEIFNIFQAHHFDLFTETYPDKPSSLERKSEETIQHRILKIEAYEYQQAK